MPFAFLCLGMVKLREICFKLEIVLHSFWNKIQGETSVNVQLYIA